MTELDRRQLGEAIAAFGALLASGAAAAAAEAKRAESSPKHDMSDMPANWMGKEKIAFLIYPGFTALDMVGPQYMLANLMGAKVDIVAKSLEPVRSDTGLVFTPSMRFDDASPAFDIICAPGGSQGTLAAMRDDATVAFIRDAGRKARYVTSVCTGSMLLGAAGLLDGYRATSHWATKPLLPIVGAIPAEGRFVQDRNRITAEGVTAGLDFALSLVGQLRDEKYAQGVQLLAQYAPDPPFHAGEPETAPKDVTRMIDGMFVGLKKEMRLAAAAAYAKSRSL
ncbi:DJ-1/PfpI family protein [Methylocystis parvus]|uniref:DJ-1/PfpI family protein n=1 Tax=Methylocystis parvus TaxID=134 RepID=A0A6B8M962_9HYPH|nr:DJ-1/PfpI family protein [Methylocystis parvus]QGM99186.1 DJ-1/PfpI family protein [Methylocystis parvus]WBK00435.1 DJ-1/PfpI family protein [Methylocystis parvus OBBP]